MTYLLSLEALSGVSGSILIASWIFLLVNITIRSQCILWSLILRFLYSLASFSCSDEVTTSRSRSTNIGDVHAHTQTKPATDTKYHKDVTSTRMDNPLISWLQVPQMMENYSGQSAEGISSQFLGIWLFGDVTNLMVAVYGKLPPLVIAIAAYFCLADAFSIGQCLYCKWLKPRPEGGWGSAPASDDANQPLLYRKDSDIGFPGSRRRSSASQAKQNSDFTSAGFPATKEDEINSKRWFWNIISILSVSLVGAVIWTSAWKARFW